MYTQIHYGVRLRKDVPENVVEVLKFMLGDSEHEPNNLPSHELFQKDRWKVMFQCDSYYFQYKTAHYIALDEITGAYWFNVTSNFKNYDGEIEAFCDWIEPYVYAYKGEFLGYSRYEENEVPDVIYMRLDNDWEMEAKG